MECEDFLSNEVISQKNLTEQENEKEDITPNKPSYILNLLSNLEGLTPAGLDHLMVTQERLAATTKTAPLYRNETLSNEDDKFCSDNGENIKIDQQRHSVEGMTAEVPLTSRIQKSHSLYVKPYPSARNDLTGSCTARQVLNFVDVSDDKNMNILPSPAPSATYATSSNATPIVSSSRFFGNNRSDI